jgi:hypothetical protein
MLTALELLETSTRAKGHGYDFVLFYGHLKKTFTPSLLDLQPAHLDLCASYQASS